MKKIKQLLVIIFSVIFIGTLTFPVANIEDSTVVTATEVKDASKKITNSKSKVLKEVQKKYGNVLSQLKKEGFTLDFEKIKFKTIEYKNRVLGSYELEQYNKTNTKAAQIIIDTTNKNKIENFVIVVTEESTTNLKVFSSKAGNKWLEMIQVENKVNSDEQARDNGVDQVNAWGNACSWGLGGVGLYHCAVWGAFTVAGGLICAGGYYVATNVIC